GGTKGRRFLTRVACLLPRANIMAILHTDIPTEYLGEKQLAQVLAGFPDPHFHLWFALKLPGVRDIDCLFWHEQIGVFLVEVKAVPINFVEEFDLKRCKIRERNRDKSPVCQAYEAYISLLDYLKSRGSWRPFIISTACWPQISRRQWREHWDNPDLGADFS